MGEKVTTCSDCKFCATEDQGYSNYTVLETDVFCLKNAFERVCESNVKSSGAEFKNFMQDSAKNCAKYRAIEEPYMNAQLHLEIDWPQYTSADPEIQQAIDEYNAA